MFSNVYKRTMARSVGKWFWSAAGKHDMANELYKEQSVTTVGKAQEPSCCRQAMHSKFEQHALLQEGVRASL